MLMNKVVMCFEHSNIAESIVHIKCSDFDIYLLDLALVSLDSPNQLSL